MINLLALLSAYFLSFSLTLLAIKLGYKFNIYSIPRKRDFHKRPIPRIGGLAIWLSFVSILLIYFFLIIPETRLSQSNILGHDKQLLGILLGAIFIALTMFIDDIRGLKAWQKLLIQIISVLPIIASGIGIDHIANPFGETINLNSIYIPIFNYRGIVYHFSLWSDLLTLIWMVGMMNVINFIDGIDGLASGISIIASLTIFFVSITMGQPALALIAIVLVGSSLGFLSFNYPPAKIFMGDSGSMFLGFMLGVMPLLSGGKLATAFLVLGFPIIDGLIVAGGRLLRGQNPFNTPDKTHLHHRFISAGFTSRQALWSMWLIATAFAWVSLRSTTLNKLIASFVLVVVLVAIIQILNHRARR